MIRGREFSFPPLADFAWFPRSCVGTFQSLNCRIKIPAGDRGNENECHSVKRYPVVLLVPTLPRWNVINPGNGEFPAREHENRVP